MCPALIEAAQCAHDGVWFWVPSLEVAWKLQPAEGFNALLAASGAHHELPKAQPHHAEAFAALLVPPCVNSAQIVEIDGPFPKAASYVVFRRFRHNCFGGP